MKSSRVLKFHLSASSSFAAALSTFVLSAVTLTTGVAIAAGPAPAESTTLAKNTTAHEKVVPSVPAIPSSTAEHLLTKDDAARLAVQHLTLRNNRWGDPVDVKDEQDDYVVVFNTPEQETQLIGRRAVMVDKESGLAHIRERR